MTVPPKTVPPLFRLERFLVPYFFRCSEKQKRRVFITTTEYQISFQNGCHVYHKLILETPMSYSQKGNTSF